MRKASTFGVMCLVTLGLLWTPFSVQGATIYQQLTDSGGAIGTGNIATFVSFSAGLISGGQFQLSIYNSMTSSTTLDANGGQIGIKNAIGDTVAASQPTNCANSDVLAKETLFCVGNLVPQNGYTNYVVGEQYTVDQVSNLNGASVVTGIDYDTPQFYGYITDAVGNSIPIAPGIPGFTNVGISTTSQQVYCDQNFSTTTGLLDSLGHSISVGFCNVGVFLFVPDTTTLSQFQTLASTTRSKIPFSYYFDVQSILNSQSASTTENFFTVSLDLPDIGSTTPIGNFIPDHIEFLSTTTISQYLTESQRLTFLAWQRIILVLGFGFMLYRRIIPHKVVV